MSQEIPNHVEPDASDEPWFDQSWMKVHPLSPLVRGWLTVVAIPVILFGYNYDALFSITRQLFSGELTQEVGQNPLPYLLGFLVVVAVVVLIFGSFLLSWWFTRYKITAEHVMVKSGVLIRQHRQARLDRVQAVDLSQPLLARFVGLAELKFEVADGSGTAVSLAFLRKAEAEELRAEIMNLASGQGQGGPEEREVTAGSAEPNESAEMSAGLAQAEADSTAAPAAPMPERQIFRVKTSRLIGSILLGPTVAALLILLSLNLLLGGGVFIVLLLTNQATFDGLTTELISVVPYFANLAFLLPIVLPIVLILYRQFSTGYKFTAVMTSAGLRLRYGLTETNNQTIPPGRVQAVVIKQSPLWRPFGWHSMQVTVAGYGISDRSTLIPVGTRDEAMAMAAEMFPDLAVQNPEELFTSGLYGQGSEDGFSAVPARARVFDPLVWRRRGVLLTPTAVLIRDGRFWRQLVMLPHERIQSASLHQGPWARRRAVATLNLHIPSGPVVATVKNQDLDFIQQVFATENRYAATARRLSDRNQWMRPEEVQELERRAYQESQRADAEEPEMQL